MSAFLIRPAAVRDLRAVQDLLVRALDEAHGRSLAPDKIAGLNQAHHSMAALSTDLDDPHASFLVAESRTGAIAGHAVGRAADARTLRVHRLFVRADHQRLGIGSALLAALASRHPAATRMTLDVETTNADARAFYADQGFVPYGERVEDWRMLIQLAKPLMRPPGRTPG